MYKERKGLFLVKKEHQFYYQNLEFVDPTVERRDIIFNIYKIKPLFKSTLERFSYKKKNIFFHQNLEFFDPIVKRREIIFNIYFQG